ncbi:hypothetical protein FHW69_002740 [Luteibacter sp. Sphag1AF]|nr:hypothetical protein [Luteibacter sp. Sphag1AF]
MSKSFGWARIALACAALAVQGGPIPQELLNLLPGFEPH